MGIKNVWSVVILLSFVFFVLSVISIQASEGTESEAYFDAIHRLREQVSKMASFSMSNPEDILQFRSTTISNNMIYSANGERSFLIFGQLTQLTKEGKISYQPHEKLFWLVNDTLALQAFLKLKQKKADPKTDQMADEYLFRVLTGATYLECFLDALERHSRSRTLLQVMRNNPDNDSIKAISKDVNGAYILAMKKIALRDATYGNRMAEKLKNGGITDIPMLPLGMGNRFRDDTVLLNVYMTKEMGDQMRTVLAKLQLEGIREQMEREKGRP